MGTKFVIEVEPGCLHDDWDDIDWVREAVDMGCDAHELVLKDITHYDSYEDSNADIHGNTVPAD